MRSWCSRLAAAARRGNAAARRRRSARNERSSRCLGRPAAPRGAARGRIPQRTARGARRRRRRRAAPGTACRGAGRAPWSRSRLRHWRRDRGRQVDHRDEGGCSMLTWGPSPADAVGPRRSERSGAQEKTRTSTTFRPLEPESSASTNSATWAGRPLIREGGPGCQSFTQGGAGKSRGFSAAPLASCRALMYRGTGHCEAPAGSRGNLAQVARRRGGRLRRCARNDGLARRHRICGRRRVMQLGRATVLGGSGCIGRHIVQRLAAKGLVVAVVSRHASDAGFLRPLGDVGQIALIDAGLGDEARLAAALAGADAVICSVGILYERGRQSFEAVHVQGPALLARLAQAAGVKRFVHISALGADIHSPSAYARSKAEGEPAVRAGFPGATILQPSIEFGPEDGFFHRFAVFALYLPALPLIGGGMTRFQPVYVGDVADAAVAALDRHEAPGRIYQLGGPRIYTFKELMELMLREIRRRRALINIPFALARFEAFFLERLPGAILTRDQVKLLERDNVVAPGSPGLGDLGITPTAVELVLPTYLEAYRRGGRYADTRTIVNGPSKG